MRHPGTTGSEIATTIGSEGVTDFAPALVCAAGPADSARVARVRMSAPVALMLSVVPLRQCCSFPIRYDTGRHKSKRRARDPDGVSLRVGRMPHDWAVHVPLLKPPIPQAAARARDRSGTAIV
jgi:hypothetical protein